jgi:predicted HTH transcriptional regulator
LNEIDWKNVLSPKTDRLAQHLCAFSNQEGGGFLVYGMNNDATLFSVTRGDTDAVIKKLGNIALNNLFRSVQIQHDTIDYEGNALLFIYIPEQMEKPVYLRGKTLYDSYQGSARQSVKMSPQEVKQMIAELQGLLFHEQIALTKATADDVLKLLDYNSYFQLTNRNFPKAKRQFLKFWQMPNLL